MTAPTGQLYDDPRSKPLSTAGAFQPGCYLCFFTTGTTTPTNVYSDGLLTTPLSQPTAGSVNPVAGTVADSAGRFAAIYLNPATIYRVQLYNAAGSLLADTDPYVVPITAAALTAANIGTLLYPVSAAETTAAVTVVNSQYPWGSVDRYGTNTTPGTTAMTSAFQAAINQARVGGADVTWGATGLYNLTGVLDCTFNTGAAQYGINFRQMSTPGMNLPSNTRAGILVSHSAYAVFDLVGCQWFAFYDMTLVGAVSSTPMTCFLMARNSTSPSSGCVGRFNNTHIDGAFTTALLYNYAGEDNVHIGNYWVNSSSASGAKLIAITAYNNVLAGNGAGSIGMVSSFATIATGAQSCIDHQFFGNQYVMTNASATSDVFYLDGCQHVKLFGPWAACASGRSYIYAETANALPAYIKVQGFQGENSSNPSYGVLIGNAAGTVTEWFLRDIYWGVNTASLGSSNASMVVDNFRISGLAEQSTKGILVTGTLQNSIIEYVGTITVSGTATKNNIIGTKSNITLPSSVGNNIIFDTPNANLYVGNSIAMSGNAQPGQVTGWGTPVGGTAINNYNITDAGGANSNTNKALAEVITVLKAFGLLGT